MNPVLLQVLNERLAGIVREMQNNLFRTGYSTIVRESQDASCCILDHRGNVVAEHAIASLHLGCLPVFVKAIINEYGTDLAADDVYISNHPFLSGITHTSDIAVAVPIFASDSLIGFCASIGHKSDLGGVVPGTAYGNAREIFQEGVLFPCVRYARRGEVLAEVRGILEANTREPEVVLGDLGGQIGTLQMGIRRIAAMAVRYGARQLREGFVELQATALRRLEAEIACWPDGVFAGEAVVDSGANGLRTVRLALSKSGGAVRFDFSGSDPQSRGPANTHPAVVRAACWYALIAATDPTLPNNGGVAEAVEVVCREGTILNPRFPAATNSYIPVAMAVAEAVFRALAAMGLPRRMAEPGCSGAMTISGTRDNRSRFVFYELLGSAYGARPGQDGVSGINILFNNVRITPVEIVEAEFPLRVTHFALITDSGGAGEYRGGLSFKRCYEILCEEAELSFRGGKFTVAPKGIDGGGPGRVGNCTVLRGEGRTSLSTNVSGVELKLGDVVAVDRAGGGGLGSPKRRSREALEADLADGYVSPEAARTLYRATETR